MRVASTPGATGHIASMRFTSLALVALPSSSPANASVSYAEKRRLWAAIGEFLR